MKCYSSPPYLPISILFFRLCLNEIHIAVKFDIYLVVSPTCLFILCKLDLQPYILIMEHNIHMPKHIHFSSNQKYWHSMYSTSWGFLDFVYFSVGERMDRLFIQRITKGMIISMFTQASFRRNKSK